MNETLAIGYCHPGHVDAHFMQSVNNLMAGDHHRTPPRILEGGALIAVGSGPRIAEARNQIVSQFLGHTKAEWLLMVDTDMIFSPQMVDKLFEAADPQDCPILGGLCFGGGRSGILFPTMYRLVKPETVNDSPVQVIEEYPDDAVCEVDATGAAFLLMHRGVLEKMGQQYRDSPYPWFLEGSVYKGTKFGEDWAFCMRAKELGYPIHVHTGAKIGHMKPQVLDEELWFSFKAKKAAVGEAAVAQNFKAKVMGAPEKPKDIPNYVVIPQKGKVHLTVSLMKQLHEQGHVDGIFVFDNGSTQTEFKATREAAEKYDAQVIAADGLNIHQMWNNGLFRAQTAAEDGPCNVAILNNDLRIGPHFLLRLATALRADENLLAVCPNYDKRPGSGVQYVMGTWGMGGMSGFAFMIRGEHFDFPFDEDFSWWYGDDDFALSIFDQGKSVGLVHACSVEHIGGGSQTIKDHPIDELVAKDRQRFMDKHGFVEREDGLLVRELQGVS